MSRILTVMTIITAAWVSACAAQAEPPPASTATRAVPVATIAPPTSAPVATLRVPMATGVPQTKSTPAIVQIGDNDKGKTVAASVGANIQVVLHSTYWQFEDTFSPALKRLGPPVVTPDINASIPGTGAGTVAVDYQAAIPGQATIRATRVSCGEALLCAEDQRVFQVMIVIK